MLRTRYAVSNRTRDPCSELRNAYHSAVWDSDAKHKFAHKKPRHLAVASKGVQEAMARPSILLRVPSKHVTVKIVERPTIILGYSSKVKFELTYIMSSRIALSSCSNNVV